MCVLYVDLATNGDVSHEVFPAAALRTRVVDIYTSQTLQARPPRVSPLSRELDRLGWTYQGEETWTDVLILDPDTGRLEDSRALTELYSDSTSRLLFATPDTIRLAALVGELAGQIIRASRVRDAVSEGAI